MLRVKWGTKKQLPQHILRHIYEEIYIYISFSTDKVTAGVLMKSRIIGTLTIHEEKSYYQTLPPKPSTS